MQQIALQSGEDSEEARDAVKLMTIHSSKGLEFPVVFILGFTEGVFPSAKTMGDRKKLGLEEERRLCYVAITRAEKYLFLMESEGTSSNGMKKLISRFLEEIGEKNYVRIGRISEELQRESKGYAAKLNRELQTESTEGKAVGDVVEHHAFGKGTIVSIDERRGSYSIQFEKLQHPRNISAGYFKKEHGSARPAPEEGKRESRADMPQNSEVEKAEENEEVPAARSSAITAEPEKRIVPEGAKQRESTKKLPEEKDRQKGVERSISNGFPAMEEAEESHRPGDSDADEGLDEKTSKNLTRVWTGKKRNRNCLRRNRIRGMAENLTRARTSKNRIPLTGVTKVKTGLRNFPSQRFLSRKSRDRTGIQNPGPIAPTCGSGMTCPIPAGTAWM